MPRSLRIERPGAWRHATARGNERRAIYRDDRDRLRFCEVLGEAAEMFGWRIHAYVLMDNHFHLLVETPEPNLGRGMQWLNTSYCVWFNRRHQRADHLLQGRFKSVVVDPVGWGLEISRHVHLNPVRVGRLGLAKAARQRDHAGAGPAPDRENIRRRIDALRAYRWSSYRAYLDLAKTPPWLRRQAIWALGGFKGPNAKADYRRHVESAVRQGLPENPWEKLRASALLGAAAIVKGLGGRVSGAAGRRDHRPTLDQIIQAVERVKREKWRTFRDRHGDWGRDLVLHLGRKHGGLPLRDLGQATGMGGTAVSMAVKRTRARMETDAALAAALKSCQKQLQL